MGATPILDLPLGSDWLSPIGVPAPRLGVSQDLGYNAAGGAVVLSAAFGKTTQMVRVVVPPSSTNQGVRIAIGSSPNPGAQSALMIPGSIEHFKVNPGEVIGAVSTDTNTGAINIVECVSLVGI